MTEQEIMKVIRCGETSTVQFKQRFTSAKQIAEEFVAFANSKGGRLIFGVEDKTGIILGLSYDEIQSASRELGNVANDQVRPTIFLQTETVEVEGKMLLVADIQEGLNKPYKDLLGNIYVKQGADKRRLTENTEILRLFHESNRFAPDESPVYSTTINDVDSRLFASYIRKVYECEVEDFGIPYEQLLNNLRIIDEQGHLTLAGLMFFGKQPQKYCPSFMIKAVSFYGNDLGGMEYRDSKDIEGTIPEMFEQGMMFLKSNLHQVQAGQNFNSVGKLEVSQVALEEILQNALVHREYIKTAPIRLLIFDNRVEIISPGALADGLTVDDIKLGITFQRNQLIAGFCAKTMLYRGLGSGLLRAHKDGAKMQFLNSESGKQFTTIIYRDSTLKGKESAQKTTLIDAGTTQKTTLIDAETTLNTTLNGKKSTLMSEKTPQKELLTTLQMKVLDYLKLHPTASRWDLAEQIDIATIDGIKYSLARLQDLGFLQRHGSKRSGHWEVLNY